MAQQPITKKGVRSITNNLRLQVQRGKVKSAKTTLRKLQRNKQLAKNKDLVAYRATIIPANKYDNVENFHKWMARSAKNWRNKFTYITVGVESDNKRISDAADLAMHIVETQTRAYPEYKKPDNRPGHPGFLLNSIRTFVNGDESQTPHVDIRRSPQSPIFSMVNIAPYASKVEANAYVYGQTRGIFFYAARQVLAKYPDLDVKFQYEKAGDYGQSHKYDLPALYIGARGSIENPTAWSTPGVRYRARKRLIARQERLQNGG